MYSNETLLSSRIYSIEEIGESSLIVHPQILHKYNLVADQIAHIFEEWSNFTVLENPIVDEHGNQYRDSEWYYMAQRVANLEIKKFIAFCSIARWLSKKAAYRHKVYLNTDPEIRIESMRKAIKYKFDNNPNLQKLLLQTDNRQIIEYTYRWDRFFGIHNEDNTWANILGKLLMEYRDQII